MLQTIARAHIPNSVPEKKPMLHIIQPHRILLFASLLRDSYSQFVCVFESFIP